MISDVLKLHGIKSGAAAPEKSGDPAGLVEYGYAQVEPNHLSAQRTGQIYAQLPADSTIDKLENGQFVDYDYAAGLVKLPGGVLEPMLVFNEIKLYREHQLDCEFAMLKDNYNARIYSPLDPETLNWTKQSRFYNGHDAAGNTAIETAPATYKKTTDVALVTGKTYYSDDKGTVVTTPDVEDIGDYYEVDVPATVYAFDDVTAAPDMYELHYNEEPWHIEGRTKGKKMPAGTTMVPRVFKTNIGDHYTTNAVKVNFKDLVQGGYLTVGADGFLGSISTTMPNAAMVWQIVKIYTLPDRQKAVKVLRVK